MRGNSEAEFVEELIQFRLGQMLGEKVCDFVVSALFVHCEVACANAFLYPKILRMHVFDLS